MTNPTNPEPTKNSQTTNILILVVGMIIIGLLVLIFFLLIGNNAPDAGGGAPPQIELPEHLPSGPSVTALEAIHIRSGPSTDYPSYGVAPAGSVAEVIGVSPDGGWWVIKVPRNIATSGQGWVSAEFVRAENIGDPPVIEPPPLQ